LPHAYQNDFKLLTIFTLISLPFVLIVKTSRVRRAGGGQHLINASP
jgi:hypothetical protein